MSKNFLDYYRENLAHIRALGAEFAAEFPKIASRLELSTLDCQDPYVERLLEGTAFLAARVEKKIDDGFPRMLESVLSSIAPRVLFPSPSMGIVELTPDFSNEKIAVGELITKTDKFEARLPFTETPCIFMPLWETHMYPIRLAGAEYLTRDIDTYCPASKNDVSALKLSLSSENGKQLNICSLKYLDIFLNMSENHASDMQRQFIVDLNKIFVRYDDGSVVEVKDLSITIPALDGGNMAFGCDTRRLNGLGVFQEFIAHPHIFKFIRINSLDRLLKDASGFGADIIFTFKRRVPDFLLGVDTNSIKLWCVPVVNVFQKRSSRERTESEYEYHIVPERTAPLDYEVYAVENIDVFNDNNDCLFSAKPFYSVNDVFGGDIPKDYFSVHRRQRIVHKSYAQRSSYTGNEAFVSISGKNWHQYRDDITQLAADLLCTNGCLPVFIRTDSELHVQNDSSIRSARFIGVPSRPEQPLISSGSSSSWEKMSHIMLNLSSLLWQSGDIPLHMIKRIVSHYSSLSYEDTERLTDGIKSIRTEPEMFRFMYKNCNVYYENGWRVTITLSEQKFEGTGFFIFASVLGYLLNGFVPFNSCVEISLHTEEKGFITKWMTSNG